MWSYNYTNELYHYGVLGMKWGVRRAQKRSARIDRKAARKNWSDDSRDVAKIKVKSVKQMSNAELRKLNERNQLEITNRELHAKQNRGKRAVQSYIRTAGTITAVAVATGTFMKYGGRKVLDKAIDKVGDAIIGSIKL